MTDIRYLAPGTLDEAIRALAAGGSAARILAGGTDLLMWLDAARAAREIDVDLATARGDLDRALTDLDWAAGGHLPRVNLPASKDNRHAP